MNPRGALRRRANDTTDPDPPDELWGRLREAYLALRRERIELLAHLDLSLSEFVSLQLCARSPAKPTEIAEAAGVTPAGATDIIDRLERHRLVKRLSHPRDRRAVLVTLTPPGQQIFQEARALQRATALALGEALTRAERQTLIAGLDALLRALRSRPG